MKAQFVKLPWDEAGWLEESSAWIQAKLHTLGFHTSGVVDVLHQRPWSIFARVMTDKGAVYFKAPAPAFHFEAGVTQFLARRRPDCTVPLLAVDLERGWLLSSDAGITLLLACPSGEQIDYWVKILPFYVELQIEMAEQVDDLLELGIPDRRLAVLPYLYEDLLKQTESLRIGLDPGLTKEEYQRLLGLRPQVSAWCEELAAYRMPETLMHEEIHDANVLVKNDHYIFTDWSDSSISHPFFSMLVTLRAAAHRLKLDENGSEIARLRDAYLEPWTKYTKRSELSRALVLAYHLAMIARALAWYYGTRFLSDHHREPYLDYVPGWLQDFLHYNH